MKLAGRGILLVIGICRYVSKKIPSYLYKILAQVLHLQEIFSLTSIDHIYLNFLWTSVVLRVSRSIACRLINSVLLVSTKLDIWSIKLDIIGDAYMKDNWIIIFLSHLERLHSSGSLVRVYEEEKNLQLEFQDYT